MKSKFNTSTMAFLFAITCLMTFSSSCNKEKDVRPETYTMDRWVYSATNPFVDSASQTVYGSATAWVMFKGTEFRCSQVYGDRTSTVARFANTGKYAYGDNTITVPLDVEQDCRRIMEEDGREYMVFIKPLNPSSEYSYDSRYKTEQTDTTVLTKWRKEIVNL